MSELLRGWVEAEVGSLCDLINGKAFKPSDWSSEGLPIVRIQNLNKPNASYNHFGGEVEPKFLIDDGQLLFAWSGTPGTSFGAHVWNKGKAVLNQHIFKVNFNDENLDRQFFKTAINFKLEELIGKAHGGVGLRHVTKGKFEETKLPLPPLAEQKRIVAKLDALSARSARARKDLSRIDTLVTRYKQAVLSKAFSGELTKLQSDEPLKVVSVDAITAELDQGWSPKCERVPATVDDQWAVITTTSIQAIDFFPEENKLLPEFLEPRHHLQINEGDILITRAGPRVRCGVCCYVAKTRPNLMLCDKAYRLRLTENFDPELFVFLMNSPELMLEIERLKTGGNDSGLNLTQKRFKALQLPQWSMSTQQDCVAVIKKHFAKADRLAAEAKRALELTDKLDEAILAKAFRGELVPQDPNDEPASTLLERIKADRAAQPKPKRGRRKANG